MLLFALSQNYIIPLYYFAIGQCCSVGKAMARPGHAAHTPDENRRVHFQHVARTQGNRHQTLEDVDADADQLAKEVDNSQPEGFGHALHRVESNVETHNPRMYSTPTGRLPAQPRLQNDVNADLPRARTAAADEADDEIADPIRGLAEARTSTPTGLPEEIVSVETYEYLGFTTAKALLLFESWQYRRSLSDLNADMEQARAVDFFQYAIQNGVGAYGSVDDYQTINHKDQAIWRLCMTALGINEEVQVIVLSDPYAEDETRHAARSYRSTPRRNAISWVRQVMHSRWQWLHTFKRLPFPGPFFVENLDGALEQWYCRLRLSEQVPKSIRSLKTLQFLGFKVRRAAEIFADVYGDSDVLTEMENQLYLYEVIQEWIQSHDRIDVPASGGDWREIFEEVGMNNQLCDAVLDPLFVSLRQGAAWPTALACLRDVVAARWRLLFRYSEHPYPGPDEDDEDMVNMPLTRCRWS